LKLFHTVVTPTVLYGSGTWAMTETRCRALQTTQRKMLRQILGQGRRKHNPETKPTTANDTEDNVEDDAKEVLEPWVDWIRRVTHDVLGIADGLNLPEWAEEQRRRKWRWAGHTARRTDGRWTEKIIYWLPIGRRVRGHTKTRWEDEVVAFAAKLMESETVRGEWTAIANDRLTWSILEADHVAA
jgi:hypothetical protein